MDLFIELLAAFLYDGCFELSDYRKISPWIRYPVLFLWSLLTLCVITILLVIGTMMVLDSEMMGLILIFAGAYCLLATIAKFYKNKRRTNAPKNSAL